MSKVRSNSRAATLARAIEHMEGLAARQAAAKRLNAGMEIAPKRGRGRPVGSGLGPTRTPEYTNKLVAAMMTTSEFAILEHTRRVNGYPLNRSEFIRQAIAEKIARGPGGR